MYAFFAEQTSADATLKSASAYKNLAQTLSESVLQNFYDFNAHVRKYDNVINNINLEREKAEIKRQLEKKREFGHKLYDYIYGPYVEEKYDLLNRVLNNSITKEEAESLKAKHIKISYSGQSYEHCMQIKSDNNSGNFEQYHCYNEEKQIFDYVLISSSSIEVLYSI